MQRVHEARNSAPAANKRTLEWEVKVTDPSAIMVPAPPQSEEALKTMKTKLRLSWRSGLQIHWEHPPVGDTKPAPSAKATVCWDKVELCKLLYTDRLKTRKPGGKDKKLAQGIAIQVVREDELNQLQVTVLPRVPSDKLTPQELKHLGLRDQDCKILGLGTIQEWQQDRDARDIRKEVRERTHWRKRNKAVMDFYDELGQTAGRHASSCMAFEYRTIGCFVVVGVIVALIIWGLLAAIPAWKAMTAQAVAAYSAIGDGNIHQAIDQCLEEDPTGGCTLEGSYGPVAEWDVSSVTSMNHLLCSSAADCVGRPGGAASATEFNADLSGWNVTMVTNMEKMFCGASSFSSDISGWNVSVVTDMKEMFHGASQFDSSLCGWSVSRVENMDRMFRDAYAFHHDVSLWDVAGVATMVEMFSSSTNLSVSPCACFENHFMAHYCSPNDEGCGAVACAACAAGQYGDGYSENCTACAPGKYASEAGSTVVSQCVDCPVGSTTDTLDGGGGSSCDTCPVGKLSGGPTLACRCKNGTMAMDRASSAPCTSCPQPERCKPELAGYCVEGTTERGCSSCQPQWYSAGPQCFPCGSNHQLSTLVAAGIAVFALWALWDITKVEGHDLEDAGIELGALNDGETRADSSESEDESESEEVAINTKVDAARTGGRAAARAIGRVRNTAVFASIALPHIQFSMLTFLLPFGFPPILSEIGAYILRFVSFDLGEITSPECQFSSEDPASTYMVKTLLTHGCYWTMNAWLVFRLVCSSRKCSCPRLRKGLKKACCCLVNKNKKRHVASDAELSSSSHAVNAMTALYTFVLGILLQSCVKFLDCTKDIDLNVWKMDAQPAIDCWDDFHLSAVYVACGGIVLYAILIPGVLFWYQWTLRSSDADKYTSLERDFNFLQAWGWLLLKYRSGCWHFEFTIIAYKIVWIFASVLLTSHVIALLIVQVSATFVLLIWVIKQRPFRDDTPFRDETSNGGLSCSVRIDTWIRQKLGWPVDSVVVKTMAKENLESKFRKMVSEREGLFSSNEEDHYVSMFNDYAMTLIKDSLAVRAKCPGTKTVNELKTDIKWSRDEQFDWSGIKWLKPDEQAEHERARLKEEDIEIVFKKLLQKATSAENAAKERVAESETELQRLKDAVKDAVHKEMLRWTVDMEKDMHWTNADLLEVVALLCMLGTSGVAWYCMEGDNVCATDPDTETLVVLLEFGLVMFPILGSLVLAAWESRKTKQRELSEGVHTAQKQAYKARDGFWVAGHPDPYCNGLYTLPVPILTAMADIDKEGAVTTDKLNSVLQGWPHFTAETYSSRSNKKKTMHLYYHERTQQWAIGHGFMPTSRKDIVWLRIKAALYCASEKNNKKKIKVPSFWARNKSRSGAIPLEWHQWQCAVGWHHGKIRTQWISMTPCDNGNVVATFNGDEDIGIVFNEPETEKDVVATFNGDEDIGILFNEAETEKHPKYPQLKKGMYLESACCIERTCCSCGLEAGDDINADIKKIKCSDKLALLVKDIKEDNWHHKYQRVTLWFRTDPDPDSRTPQIRGFLPRRDIAAECIAPLQTSVQSPQTGIKVTNPILADDGLT